MFLITSGAYVDPSVEADFGRLPPTFLPLGSRRLVRHQYELASSFARPICLSLPDDFEPSRPDRQWLTANQVIDLRIPRGLRLGHSILRAIRSMGSPATPVRILHGDTLFGSLPTDLDVVSVNSARTPHAWATVRTGPSGELLIQPTPIERSHRPEVLSGFFAFEDPSLLVECLESSDGDFVTSLQHYGRRRQLRAFQGVDWLDLGDLASYYRARGRFTTERSFNDLDVAGRIVRKSSQDSVKMQGEIHWFRSVPAAIRMSCPTLLDDFEEGGEVGYRLEYLHLPTLAELAVFGELPLSTWSSVLEACRSFVHACRQFPQPGRCAAEDHRCKTLRRVERWASSRKTDLNRPTRLNGRRLPSLQDMIDRLAERLPSESACSLVHGDLCFSNVFYDSRAEIIRVVDPRGLSFDGVPSIGGDPLYDLAKLHHSAVGLYDFILAGEHETVIDSPIDLRSRIHERPQHALIGEAFDDVFGAERSPALTSMSALLFFAMLPLHDDCTMRQSALLANGMRLFLRAEESAS